MWYDIQNQDELLNNNILESIIKQDTKNNIFILDAPSGSGKSYFVNHLSFGRTIRVPANLLKETVFYTNDVRQNMEMLVYFLTQLNLDIMCIEDIDYSIAGLDATQELYANMVLWMSRRYKVLLTGIGINRNCKTFLELLPDHYLYFKYKI